MSDGKGAASRHLVVVCELGAPLDAEAADLARILGVTAYDVRLAFAGLLPAVACATSDLARAVDVQAALSARGHGAVVVDPRAVTPSERMVRLKRFSIAAGRLFANDREGSIATDDIAALVRAATATSVIRTVSAREPIYRGGPARPPTQEVREHVRHETVAGNLLYVFPREGAPLLLVEHEARYLSLGAAMRATEHDNFLATVDLMRAAAPGAAYDERFATRAHPSAKLALARGEGSVEPKGDAELDLLAHVLARWLTRASGSPYRDLA